MALQNLLSLSDNYNKQGMSEERLAAILPALRQYVAFWREYPDMFVDFMAGPNSSFHLYSYQRVFLRAALRHKYMYAVYPRAYSKSFMGVMSMMVKCILYPRAKLFVSAGGKGQSAGIIKEKVDEICMLIPAFERELDRKKCKENKDYVIYVFKNGSWFDNIAANERSRGKRRQSAVFEECVGIDGEILSSVLLPILNVSRTCMDGTRQDDELLNQSQLFITTAGWKNTFSYDKLMQLLVWSIVYPEKAFVTGGSYKIPVLFGLLSKNFASELQQDATFNEAAFDREYERLLYSINFMNCWDALRAA